MTIETMTNRKAQEKEIIERLDDLEEAVLSHPTLDENKREQLKKFIYDEQEKHWQNYFNYHNKIGRIERERLKSIIVSVLQDYFDGGWATISDIKNSSYLFNDVSMWKMCSLLEPLIKEGRIVWNKQKGFKCVKW